MATESLVETAEVPVTVPSVIWNILDVLDACIFIVFVVL